MALFKFAGDGPALSSAHLDARLVVLRAELEAAKSSGDSAAASDLARVVGAVEAARPDIRRGEVAKMEAEASAAIDRELLEKYARGGMGMTGSRVGRGSERPLVAEPVPVVPGMAGRILAAVASELPIVYRLKDWKTDKLLRAIEAELDEHAR